MQRQIQASPTAAEFSAFSSEISAKQLIKRTLQTVGFDVRRYNRYSATDGQLRHLLLNHRINVVLDIGANVGQYARSLRAMGYQGKIISFEPLSSAYKVLLRRSARDPHWEIAPQFALGNEDSNIEINVAANEVSSSVLPMCKTHLDAAPQSRYVGKETVPLRRLDSLAPRMLPPNAIVHLKIDAQGYEDAILEGASVTLGRIIGMQLELSLVELYEGQTLYLDMLRKVRDLGFNLHALFPVFCDPATSRLLQVDAVLFREG